MKQSKRFRRLSLLLAVALLLTLVLPGCQLDDLELLAKPRQNVQNVEDGMISGLRTGIIRQGISGQFKSYECTDDMSYFMVNANGMAMLYALEHDSDQMAPLCASDGCAHEDPSCDAYFGTNGNVCFYDDSLFVNAGTKLYRMNPDGTGRVLVLDVQEVQELIDPKQVGFNGIAEPKLWNGMFTFYLTTYTTDPEHPLKELCWYKHGRYEAFYYRLDGSMDVPMQMTTITDEIGGDLIAQYNDGENFIMRAPGLRLKDDVYHLYTWNPNSNSGEWYADVTRTMGADYEPLSSNDDYNCVFRARRYEAYGEGYWGAECAYYLQTEQNGSKVTSNILCRLDYASGSSEQMLDTGLEGSYKLACFPDCIVLIETMTNAKKVPETPKMYIYDWNMNLLGSTTLKFEIGVLPQNLICGETANRIYLAGYFTGVPQYYIDKEELSGGEINIRELNYENLNLETIHNEWTAALDDSFLLWQELMQGIYAAYDGPGKITKGPLLRSADEAIMYMEGY